MILFYAGMSYRYQHRGRYGLFPRQQKFGSGQWSIACLFYTKYQKPAVGSSVTTGNGISEPDEGEEVMK